MLSGTYVVVRDGTEGPSYDSYSYTKVAIHRNGRLVCIHMGLAVWVQRSYGKRANLRVPLTSRAYDNPNRVCRYLTGYTANEWIEFHQRAKSRCPHCLGRHFTWMSGYPGEELKICKKCEEIVECIFDESAVI